jgi:hypothetical protein
MNNSDLNIYLGALGILIALHAPPLALFCFLLGGLIGSARDDPNA